MGFEAGFSAFWTANPEGVREKTPEMVSFFTSINCRRSTDARSNPPGISAIRLEATVASIPRGLGEPHRKSSLRVAECWREPSPPVYRPASTIHQLLRHGRLHPAPRSAPGGQDSSRWHRFPLPTAAGHVPNHSFRNRDAAPQSDSPRDHRATSSASEKIPRFDRRRL